METTRILLTLNREEREVDASLFVGAQDTYLIVSGIALRTAQGQKTHNGYVWLKAQPPGHRYSTQDITDIGYSGMRGNGHGQRSQFRYIGFFPADGSNGAWLLA